MPFRHCQKKSSSNKLLHQIEKNGLHAKIYINNHQSYHGEWLNNQKHGYGKLIDHFNGSIYEGEFFQNKKHGHGRLTIRLKTGSMQRYYVGQWKNDQMNGNGTLYLNDSSYYEGEFLENKRCGWGRMYFENGDMYEGQWFNNKRHGFGLLLAANNDRYEGNWSEDKKHGHGQYYFFKQKRLFSGLWSNNFCKSAEQIFTYLTDEFKERTYEISAS